MGLRQRISEQREFRVERQRLTERVDTLEHDIVELRRHNLRLAELADLVQELLVPMAQRDDERVDAALEKLSRGL